MNFIPEHKGAQDVPFFQDANKPDGWAGHTTGKTIEKLKEEIEQALSRLDGKVIGFQKGAYPGDHQRDGFHIHYIMMAGEQVTKGIIEIAALPVKKPKGYMNYRQEESLKKQRNQSLKMALFMVRDALRGMWYLQQLSPGLVALMPFMIVGNSGKSLTRLWTEQASLANLLPPGEIELDSEEDIFDGEYQEA